MERSKMLRKFNEQQLLLMKQRILSFEKTKFSLDSLLYLTKSLEELLDSLKNIDDKWKESFRTEWWELEFTSSLMIDKEVEDLTKEDEDSVSLALQNMKIMIDDALNNASFG